MIRFDRADDQAIRLELRRHHVVLERHDQATAESTITCSCGGTFGPLPKAASVLDAYVEHFLAMLKGSAA